MRTSAVTIDPCTAGIPARRLPPRHGFALLELLLALLMLTLAIASIGTSALQVMRLEKELIADADTWRIARSVAALHQAGKNFDDTAAYALARGWTLTETALDSTAENSPAGWSIWTLTHPSRSGLAFPARFLPPPKPKTAGPSSER